MGGNTIVEIAQLGNRSSYNLRYRIEAILDIARAMQLEPTDLPEFPPKHRIGIK